jgi:hypothetical protein
MEAEGIDAGVAGDADGGFGDTFAEEVFARGVGGGEVHGSDDADHAAVGLFGEGILEVVGAEAGFDVGNLDLGVEGGERGHGGGGGVSLDDDPLGFDLFEDVGEVFEDTGGDFGQRGTGLHEVEVEIGVDVKEREGLEHDLAVLAGGADEDVVGAVFCLGACAKLGDDGRELDGFGAGADDDEETLVEQQ